MADVIDLLFDRLPYGFECDQIPGDAEVVAFRGSEGISKLYGFEIALKLGHGQTIDAEAAANARAKLTIRNVEPIDFHGIVASVELLHAWDGQTLWRVVLVPQLWLATLTHHSRVFVDKTSTQIIEDVLKASGFAKSDYELQLKETYDTQPHVTQYQESDFAFIARWMEREGMYFYFAHEEEREKLIICDHRSFHTSLREQAVRYVPASEVNKSVQREAMDTFMSRRSVRSAEVVLRDYDYIHPSLALEGTAKGDLVGQLSMWAPNFRAEGEGKRLARIRAEEALTGRSVVHGKGRLLNLHAGYTFKLEEHPQSTLNVDYLVTELAHVGHQDAAPALVVKLFGVDHEPTYRVELTAIPATVQFRAPRATPVPRVYGVINALIDGPADSTYAQLDEHGRYKVKLMLDESDLEGGAASTWIRMLQFHGGSSEGVHFPLRKETEVLVIFLGGDPDRPMICGVAPNTQKPSPVTQQNHTFNVLRTGGNNHLVIQDLDGSQYIDWSCPSQSTFLHLGAPHGDQYGDHTHCIVLNTQGDCLFNIGSNQDIEIGGDLSEHVVGDVSEDYEGDQDSFVGGDQTLEVAYDQDTEIGGDQTLEVACDQDTEIGGDQTLEVGGDQDTEIGGDCTLEVGGDWDVEVGGDCTLEGGGDYDIELAGDYTLENGGELAANIGTDVSFLVGGNWTQTITGNFSNTHAGSNKFWTIGNSATGTIGSTFSIFIGNKADLKIGNFLDAAISNKIGLALGGVDIAIAASLKLAITGGAKIDMDMAVAVKVTGGPEVKTAPTLLKAAGMIIDM